MQSANERPTRRGMRPTTILRGVGFKTTSLPLVALLGLTSASLAHAADPPARTDAAEGDKAKDADAKAEGSGAASVGASTEAGTASAEAEGKTDSGPPKAEEPPAKAPPVAGSPEGDTPGTIPAPPGNIARLPPEAYPSEPVRGIYGGSLWLTFHGLQWPTSPFQTGVPRTQLGISGSAWVDSSFQSVKTEDPSQHDANYWLHQGRFTLRATPTYTKGNLFVQGQGELVASNSEDGTSLPAHAMRTDDLWIRAGSWNKWDVQAGRFQAWEIYHLGMGLDLNTLERRGAYALGQTRAPVDIYGVTVLWDRPQGWGNLAFHVYPTRFLRAELLTQVGYAGDSNEMGVRPAAILDFGIVKVKGALEYQIIKSNVETNKLDSKKRGGGGAVQVILDPRFEVGVNAAYLNTDVINAQGSKDLQGSIDQYSLGGFANARIVDPVILGVGVNYTRKDDTQENERGEHGEFGHFQAFGAVQALVIDQLFIKFVGAYAKADYAPSTGGVQPSSDTSISGRLRLMYLF
ncbi:MAG: hypothetical protein ACOY0T_33065 [Myxococcota bacterium]